MKEEKKVSKIVAKSLVLALCIGLFSLIALSPSRVFAAWQGKNLNTVPYFKHHALKIIFQVPNNPKMWTLTIHNAKNALHFSEKYGFKHSIILAAYGPAIKMFIRKYDKKNYAILQSLSVYGIKMAVCHQTMLHMHITKDQLFNFTDVMYPGGVFYIIKKEQQGYAYIKP